MEHAFWRQRWERNEIAFHEGAPNAMLVKHWAALALPSRARVFVPLCGKTRDIGWLLRQGFRVVGAELSALAVESLFADLGAAPTITPMGALTLYAHEDVAVFQGDLFALTREMLGAVDAVYDRAALVALPLDLRARYADFVPALTALAPQLVIAFTYDQAQMDGPPFCVDADAVRALYGAQFDVALLQSAAIQGGLKGKVAATEDVWALRRRG
ncbi:MAG: thiopurine S-methyltransferase [Alphaproteobacteria bacterium]|nr:thiopurine S-methyltransferase [Alphaproteobacteria bacterium]